jgi:hypothetical protein
MTYQSYKKTLGIIGLLYLPIFLLDMFGSYFVPEAGLPFISVVVYYVYRILSLYLLFFSIYAGVSGVVGTRKLEAPAIFITVGAFLVITSFGPPILFGYFGPNVKEKHKYIESKEIEKQAKSENSLIEGRRQLDITVTNIRSTAFIQVCMLTIATIGFIFFLLYRFNKRR